MSEIEKQQILDLRLKGIGYKAIAAVIGVSRDAVRGFCKKNGLGGDEKAEQAENKHRCPCCGQVVTKKDRGRNRRFCSADCRRKWWAGNADARSKKPEAIYSYTCLHCGKLFSAYGDKERKYCSQDCYFKARFFGNGTDGVLSP